MAVGDMTLALLLVEINRDRQLRNRSQKILEVFVCYAVKGRLLL